MHQHNQKGHDSGAVIMSKRLQGGAVSKMLPPFRILTFLGLPALPCLCGTLVRSCRASHHRGHAQRHLNQHMSQTRGKTCLTRTTLDRAILEQCCGRSVALTRHPRYEKHAGVLHATMCKQPTSANTNSKPGESTENIAMLPLDNCQCCMAALHAALHQVGLARWRWEVFCRTALVAGVVTSQQ